MEAPAKAIAWVTSPASRAGRAPANVTPRPIVRMIAIEPSNTKAWSDGPFVRIPEWSVEATTSEAASTKRMARSRVISGPHVQAAGHARVHVAAHEVVTGGQRRHVVDGRAVRDRPADEQGRPGAGVRVERDVMRGAVEVLEEEPAGL